MRFRAVCCTILARRLGLYVSQLSVTTYRDADCVAIRGLLSSCFWLAIFDEECAPQYRQQRRLSRGDLAEAVGVTRQTINATKRERYDLSFKLAFALAEYFGCQGPVLTGFHHTGLTSLAHASGQCYVNMFTTIATFVTSQSTLDGRH